MFNFVFVRFLKKFIGNNLQKKNSEFDDFEIYYRRWNFELFPIIAAQLYIFQNIYILKMAIILKFAYVYASVIMLMYHIY